MFRYILLISFSIASATLTEYANLSLPITGIAMPRMSEEEIDRLLGRPKPGDDSWIPERWKYKPVEPCKELVKAMGSKERSLISSDHSGEGLYERIGCNTRHCVPVIYAKFAERCTRISFPDWRINDGEFIYGAEMQDKVCVCKIMNYQKLIDSMFGIGEIHPNMNT